LEKDNRNGGLCEQGHCAAKTPFPNEIRYECVESTNLRAKAAGNKGVSEDTLFVADKQTAGVGRRGRSWESPAGENIYMSLLLKPGIEPVKAPMLTLVMAVSVAEGIRQATGIDTQIKWPNDLILNKKKICGILTEMSLDGTKIGYVVIGVGINVNQKKFVSELTAKATSLALETSQEFDREAIISATLEKFYANYDRFLHVGDLSYLQERYNQSLVNRGCEVVIHEPGNEYSAMAIGINELGELLVETTDGVRHNVYAGEVSVRGIYGYV